MGLSLSWDKEVEMGTSCMDYQSLNSPIHLKKKIPLLLFEPNRDSKSGPAEPEAEPLTTRLFSECFNV